MASEEKNFPAARVLKILSLLLLIVFAAVSFLLLFTLLPMLFLDGKVQLDSGGFLDLLLRRTQHASGVISASQIFLGALPLLLAVLLLLADCIVLFDFLRKAQKHGDWFFAAGKGRWIAMSVLGALIAAVPPAVSAAVTPAVAASGTFAVRPWNPLGCILLFALTLGLTILYIIKTNRRLREPAQEAKEEDA